MKYSDRFCVISKMKKVNRSMKITATIEFNIITWAFKFFILPVDVIIIIISDVKPQGSS